MRKTFLFALLSILGLNSCKTTQNNNNTEIPHVNYNSMPTQSNGIWRFESKGTFKRKENVEIQFYHEQKEAVKLQRPMELKLELEVDGKWRTVRKLYCPCLQNCPPPPFEREIEAQVRTSFSWKPEEQWCEEGAKSAPAPVGKYRLIITHRKENEKQLFFQHYEFTLKK